MIQPRAPSFGARLCHALVYTHLIGERSQRRLKSNLEHYHLSLGRCQYRSIVAHQNWADLAVDAFDLILEVRKTWSTMSWKDAQLQAVQISLERVRTALFLDSTHLEAV